MDAEGDDLHSMGVISQDERAAFKPLDGLDDWQSALDRGQIEVCTCGPHTVDPDFGFTDRVMDEHILNLIVDGAMTVVVGGVRRHLPAGSVIWIGPGTAHDFQLSSPGRVFSMINTRWRLLLDHQPCTLPGAWACTLDRWDMRPLFDMMVDDHQRRRPNAAARMRRILYLLHGDLDDDRPAAQGPVLNRSRRQAVIDYMHLHAHRRFSPATLAHITGLSSDYFRRAFHRTFGCSPGSWIVRERIHLAAQRLIEAPLRPIGTIATDFGYDDIYLFSRQFKTVMGQAPSRWRRLHA